MLRVLSIAYATTMGAALLWWTAQSTPQLQPGYDWANRALVIPLALLVGTLIAVRRLVGLRAATVAATGAGLMFAGNVIEFWFGLLQNAPLSGEAHRLGLPESSVWIGSDIGFFTYLAGLLVLIIGTIVLGIQALRREALGRPAAIALLATGLLQLAAFAVKDISVPAAAGIAGLIVLSGIAVAAVTAASPQTALA